MKIGDLKKSLAKHPPDMDDVEIMMVVSRNGKRQFEPLCFLAYYPLPDHECIVLGGLTAVQTMVEDGEIEKPPGYIDPEDSDPSIFGDSGEGH